MIDINMHAMFGVCIKMKLCITVMCVYVGRGGEEHEICQWFCDASWNKDWLKRSRKKKGSRLSLEQHSQTNHTLQKYGDIDSINRINVSVLYVNEKYIVECCYYLVSSYVCACTLNKPALGHRRQFKNLAMN